MSSFTNTPRMNALCDWLSSLALDSSTLTPLAGDASFRRYFRLKTVEKTLIIMDAPPEKENNQAFYDIAHFLLQHHINAPNILHIDFISGWMVLDDFGNTLLSDKINTPAALTIYQQALTLATDLLALPLPKHFSLPAFDASMQLRELHLFSDWFIKEHLHISLIEQDIEILEASYKIIINQLLSQLQVFVHRDFHCRNLMVLPDKLAVIDFQDAVVGPYTYDLISLIKDAYTDYAYKNQEAFIDYFWSHAPESIKIQKNKTQFLTDLRWTGIQRHLKVIGIFSRLYHRDGKEAYLASIPLVFDYLLEALAKTPELQDLYQLIQTQILPHYQQQIVVTTS